MSLAHWNYFIECLSNQVFIQTSCFYLQKNVVEIAKHALATEYPGSKVEKYLNSYDLNTLFDKYTELRDRKNALMSVVCQNDCWVLNFLARDVGQNLKEALMLDFQLVRCANPVTDRI